MNVAQLKNSQFLKKEDVGAGLLVTIKDCTQENVALPGAPEELKWALHFNELEKPLILNQTNGGIIQSILGSAESDDWIGKKIVLYTDPNVSFGGKITGGIRVRAPRNQPAPAKAAARPQAPRQPAPALDPYDAQPDSPPDDPDQVPF